MRMYSSMKKRIEKLSQDKAPIPKATLARLPLYLRSLYILEDEGRKIVMSSDIAERMGIDPTQLRKDLSFIGVTGKRGVGYETSYLIKELEKYLGMTRKRKVIVVGIGRLGSALLHYRGFKERNLEFVAAFDNDPEKIGKKLSGIPVYDFEKIEQVLKKKRIDIAIITVPPDEAQKVVDKVVSAGVRSVLNFAVGPLSVPESIPFRTVCLAAEMQLLSYYIKDAKDEHPER